MRMNLESLNRLKTARMQITVVDNKSHRFNLDETRACSPPNTRFIFNYANFTANINFIRAIAVSDCAYRHLVGDDDMLLESYGDLPVAIDKCRPDIIAFDPEVKNDQMWGLKDYIVKKCRDPLGFNNLWHITTFIYSRELFDATYALRHVNSLYPHAWALLGPIFKEKKIDRKTCLVLPQAKYIQVSHFTSGLGKARPGVDESEGWTQAYLEKAFQSSLFTLWCKTWISLVDESYSVEYLKHKYCKRISTVFPGAHDYLLNMIEYNEGWF